MKIEKCEKVTDKALNRNIILAVLGILLCLTMLSASTWAWFDDSVTSVQNNFTSGEYLIEVVITDSEGNAAQSVTDRDGKARYRLSANGVYSITLTGKGTVSGGYCIIEYADGELYSQQIYTEKTESTPKQITFSFCAELDTELLFSACWGYYNGEPDVTDGCEILLSESDEPIEADGEEGR